MLAILFLLLQALSLCDVLSMYEEQENTKVTEDRYADLVHHTAPKVSDH